MTGPTAEQHVRDFVRACVRAGVLDDQALHREVGDAVAAELPEGDRVGRSADELAASWVLEFREELLREQETWPAVTDYDRLQAAFHAIAALDVVVLQGCEDHWAAKAELDARRDDPPRGVAWFTPPDIWHAIDEGMLEVNLWHGTTANVAPGDALLEDAIAAFATHDLDAHYDEGRIEVRAHWQRRLAAPAGDVGSPGEPGGPVLPRRNSPGEPEVRLGK